MDQGTMICLAGAGMLAALASASYAAPAPAAQRAPAAADQASAAGDRSSPAEKREELAAELRALKKQLAEQRALLHRLDAELARTEAPPGLRAPVVPAKAGTHAERPGDTATDSRLRGNDGAAVVDASFANARVGSPDAARGTGPAPTPAAQPAPADKPASAPQPAPAAQPAPSARPVAAASPAPAATPPTAGTPGPARRRAPEVAPIFEQPGVLTPRGKYVLEPALQFGYSSSNRVALVGYSIIPSLLIGLVDVREVKRSTTTFALTARTGLTNRLEVEARVPYVYRSDSTVSRELFTGTAVERVFHTSGRDLGDVELAVRYQLNDGGADRPYYVAGLRYKTRTGRDPFEVVTDCVRRCIGENTTGTGLPLELPTGSGFHAVQPSLTVLMPSDPAVLFGSISYLHNFKRNGVERTVLGGEKEMLGEVDPGGVFGFNFGLGIALNDKLTLSFGYDHNSIERMRQGGAPVPGAVRTQLGTLLVGFGYRKSDRRSINVAVGAGLTRDTPDVTITVRVPTTF